MRSLESLLYCPHCQKMVRPQGPGPGEILLEQKQVCSECNNQIPGYVGGVFSPEDILGEEEEADAGSYDSDKMLARSLAFGSL